MKSAKLQFSFRQEILKRAQVKTFANAACHNLRAVLDESHASICLQAPANSSEGALGLVLGDFSE